MMSHTSHTIRHPVACRMLCHLCHMSHTTCHHVAYMTLAYLRNSYRIIPLIHRIKFRNSAKVSECARTARLHLGTTCEHVKSPHTRAGQRKPEGGHPCKQTQTLSYSFSIAVSVFPCPLFPNALCVLLFCDDDSFSSCSIAVSVLFLASFPLLLASFFLPPHAQSLSDSFS